MIADIIFLAIMVLLALRCYARGIITEVLSIAAYVLGLFMAFIFFKQLAQPLHSWWPNIELFILQAIAFVLIFLVTFIFVRMLASFLKTGLEVVHLGIVDRILGLVLGLIEGLVAVAIIIFIWHAIQTNPYFSRIGFFRYTPSLENSLFAQILLPLMPF